MTANPSTMSDNQVALWARDEILRLQRKILRLELALSCAVPILEAATDNDSAAVALMIRASCEDVRLPRPPRGKPKLAFTNNDPFLPVAEIMGEDHGR